MRRRKICIVSTSRADYGLLYWLLKEIINDNELKLQLIVSGMHLVSEFGNTYKVIEQDGFRIDKKIKMLISSDSEKAVIKSIGVGLGGFADSLSELRPDILVLLGDRFELFAPAIAALNLRIPIAHIHGGETSQGAVDEAVRHSITKMAAIHFPATEVYRKRIIQMGENPKRVFNYGAPGLDYLKRTKFLSKTELENRINFSLYPPIAIVTFHPVTLEVFSENGLNNMLVAITESNIRAVFTKANADKDGRKINRTIKNFCADNSERFRLLDNLGQDLYFSCLKHFDIMIGNSSSGLIEAPSFKLPVINIGDRQKGRIKANNIIDCNYSKPEIKKAIKKSLSDNYKKSLKDIMNPYQKYSDGKSSTRIKDKLKTINLSDKLIKKEFYDINFP